MVDAEGIRHVALRAADRLITSAIWRDLSRTWTTSPSLTCRGDVDPLAVHGDVAVVHELAGGEHGRHELGAVDHGVEPALEQADQVLAGVAAQLGLGARWPACRPSCSCASGRCRCRPTTIPGFGAAIERLRETWHHAKLFPDMRRFMLCIVFYQAGIQAVIALAAIYAEQAMGFKTADTIKLVFLVNVTAAIGAFAFGHLEDRIGHVRAIQLTLVGWIVMVLLAWGAEGASMFWVAANIAGFCLGASQSAARALVGALAPPARHAEFFGLWGLAVKFSSVLGPLTYGVVTWITGGDHRLAILVTGGYFVVGLIILRGVDAERGRRAALESAS